MSVFSDLLNRYIKEKDIKIYSLAAACQMDRSMLYRIISGKRNPPSQEVFYKLAEYLQLAPAEFAKLQDAYDLTRLGPSVYYRRKSVEKFLNRFPSHITSENIQFLFHKATFSPELPSVKTACIPIFSRTDMDYYSHSILLMEAAREKGSVQLLIQPDCPFLFSTLSSLRLKGALTIEHLICFSKTGQLTPQRQLYNLNCLETMLPLFFTDMDYKPYYFYDDIVAHYKNFNGFPCMIITSEYALVCTADYQKGFLYKGSGYLRLLQDLYQSYKLPCKPLFHVINYLPMDGSLQQMYRTNPSYILQPEACITPLIDDNLLEKAVYPQLPDRDTFIRQSSALLANNRKLLSSEKIFIYFTIPGLRQFLSSGRVHEIPEEVYRPLTPSEGKQILAKMIPYCKTGVYRLLKYPLSQLTENLHLVANQTMGYLLFKDIHGQILCLTFNEPSLLEAFLDYMESLDHGYIYPYEDAARMVQKLINES